MPVPRASLVPGGRYHIELVDCCVTGDLVGRFEGVAEPDDGEDEDADYLPLIFDIGTFTCTYGLKFTEIAG